MTAATSWTAGTESRTEPGCESAAGAEPEGHLTVAGVVTQVLTHAGVGVSAGIVMGVAVPGGEAEATG